MDPFDHDHDVIDLIKAGNNYQRFSQYGINSLPQLKKLILDTIRVCALFGVNPCDHYPPGELDEEIKTKVYRLLKFFGYGG